MINYGLIRSSISPSVSCGSNTKPSTPDGYQYTPILRLFTGSGAAALITACARKHRAGEKVFVDYTDGLAFVDIRSGEIIPHSVVCGRWGAL